MRTMSFIVAAVLLIHSSLVAAEMEGQATEKLLQLERDFQNAIIQNDVPAIERFLADDWIIIDAGGNIMDKGKFLGVIKSGALKHTAMTLEEPSVRIYGDTAIVTGRATSAGSYAGTSFTTLERSTDVFVKVADRWECVLTQLTRLTPHSN